MGVPAKGLLPAPSGERSLVERWQTLLVRMELRCVLVGRRAEYAAGALPVALDDDPAGGPSAGPLGGLVALLEAAGTGTALALACDMPYVSEALLARLLDAPPCAALAPRRDGRWEPLCARYEATAVLPVARARLARGERSLQGLLDALGARSLEVTASETRELDDWDTPMDRTARR